MQIIILILLSFLVMPLSAGAATSELSASDSEITSDISAQTEESFDLPTPTESEASQPELEGEDTFVGEQGETPIAVASPTPTDSPVSTEAENTAEQTSGATTPEASEQESNSAEDEAPSGSITMWRGTSVIDVVITGTTPSGFGTTVTVRVSSEAWSSGSTGALNFVSSGSGAAAFALAEYNARYPDWINVEVYVTSAVAGSEPQVVSHSFSDSPPEAGQTRSITSFPLPEIGSPQ